MAVSKEQPREKRSSGGGLYAALALVLAIPVIVLVLRSGAPETSQRGPFSEDTTNRGELRRVHEALSRLFAAPQSQLLTSVETLEAVRAESPGARDMKEACVNTYRGLLRAQEAGQTVRSLLLLPDGGHRAAVPAAEQLRAQELLRTAQEQTELVSQSHRRCHDLYGEASVLLGLTPVRPQY